MERTKPQEALALVATFPINTFITGYKATNLRYTPTIKRSSAHWTNHWIDLTFRSRDNCAQFGPRVVHITGAKNIVDDTLSRCTEELESDPEQLLINALSILPPIDNSTMIKEQASDEQLKLMLQKPQSTSLQLELIGEIYCDKTDNKIRSYIPATLRKDILNNLHNYYHSGVKQPQRSICERFVWPYMKKDIKKWVQ